MPWTRGFLQTGRQHLQRGLSSPRAVGLCVEALNRGGSRETSGSSAGTVMRGPVGALTTDEQLQACKEGQPRGADSTARGREPSSEAKLHCWDLDQQTHQRGAEGLVGAGDIPFPDLGAGRMLVETL